MMDMDNMMDRCVDAMGSMMGGTMGTGLMLVVLLTIFVVWVIGLAVVGALVFWGLRRFARPYA